MIGVVEIIPCEFMLGICSSVENILNTKFLLRFTTSSYINIECEILLSIIFFNTII